MRLSRATAQLSRNSYGLMRKYIYTSLLPWIISVARLISQARRLLTPYLDLSGGLVTSAGDV